MDGGESWTRRAGEVVAASSSSEYHVSDPFLVAADDPDTVFAMGGSTAVDDYLRWLFRSTDGGDTWSLVLGGDTPPEERADDFVESVVADPDESLRNVRREAVEAAGGPRFQQRPSQIDDTGATWTVISPEEWVADRTMIAGITVDPRVPSTVYVLRSYGRSHHRRFGPRLVRSLRRRGTTWEEVQVPASRWGNLPLFDPRSADTLYIGGPEYGLYRSVDGGATWQNITGGALGGATHRLRDRRWLPAAVLYAAADNGLYRWVPDQE